MNYIIMLTLLISTIYAQDKNTYGKIDMHGGKKNSMYQNDKNTFKSPNFGMSNFLDDNKSKKTIYKKK